MTATGVGSLPYEDVDEALRVVLGELPDLPHLPELPARGAGADLVGRSAAMLVDLHVDLQPAGWRLVDRAGADEARARGLLARDLDALQVQALDLSGPLKVQVAGPLTLAATLETTRGARVLADHGARRDLAMSLSDGIAAHLADVRRRVPGAEVVLQLDEPALPAVLAGAVPTASGFSRHRPVEAAEAEQAIAAALAAADGGPTVVHCCASDVPVGVLLRSGASAVSFDLRLLRDAELAGWAEAVDKGLRLYVGALPTAGPVPTVMEGVERIRRLWRALDRPDDASTTVVTPACGLAGATPPHAREVLSACRQVAAALADG